MLLRRLAVALLCLGVFASGAGMVRPAVAGAAPGSKVVVPPVDMAAWNATVEKARGQTVFLNAWGGSPKINAYWEWVATTVRDRYGIELRHVRITDIGQAVTRILTEKTAGRTEGGSIDLVWLNGGNFAPMKANGLLYGPFTNHLPNMRLVDTRSKPTLVDFTVPVEGMEAPFSVTQFVMVYDTLNLPVPPRSVTTLLEWAKANPGRLAYPQPPNSLGITFLKQVLLALQSDWSSLMQPATDENEGLVLEPLWSFLDTLHPLLWRQGKEFPATGATLRALLKDGEITLSMAFNPLEAASSIESGLLPSSTRVYTFEEGTVGNANFLAIPFNASAKEGAEVIINFLLSPEAQARKQDPRYWGADTVLSWKKLTQGEKELFRSIPQHPAAPLPDELAKPLPEPHPSWTDRIEKGWHRRYAAG